MRKIFTFLFAALMSAASMWAQTETLLTTITATGVEQANYSTEGVATVSFSYTAGGSSAYLALWGWWGYGWSATVNAAEGYTITKCVFYDDANRTATDSEAPFVVETTDEDKTPKVNGTPIMADMSKGIKKIDVYGYATPEPEPEPTTTVVTITDSDFPAWGDSFTKDGVTVSAEMLDGMYGNISGPGSFSTTLGNFTKIEIFAEDVFNLGGEGWSIDFGKATWTGNASSVSFTGDINGNEEGVTLKFTIEPASTPEPAKYYVVGNMTEWAVDENYEMNPNIYAETEEYFYALDLTTTSEFKVVKVEGENQTWYPTGMGNNYGQNGEITEDAEYTIYFRPNYDGGEDWFYNCIYVSKNETQGVESIQPSAVSSQKVLRNGQLLIEKNGKIYNVMGAEVK